MRKRLVPVALVVLVVLAVVMAVQLGRVAEQGDQLRRDIDAQTEMIEAQSATSAP